MPCIAMTDFTCYNQFIVLYQTGRELIMNVPVFQVKKNK